jgi:hypothetical protein
MKLVSDFDGVWTDQDKEAAYVLDFIVRKISAITGFSNDDVRGLLKECRREMDKTPYEFGWYNSGKISAYYQEDPFGDNNSILNYIERAGNANSFSVFRQKLNDIKKAIVKNGYQSVEEFSNKCFSESTKAFKEAGKLTPQLHARSALEKVLKKGVNIVVASNSTTQKIEHLFLKMGSQPTNEKSLKPGNVHARGNAMKFVISPSFKAVPEKMKIAGRFEAQLRRKSYFELLLDEMPDYVLGDVFSLDLALPLYLRRKDERFSKLRVIQKVQAHTPGWVKDFLSKKMFNGIAFMIEDMNELPDVIKW